MRHFYCSDRRDQRALCFAPRSSGCPCPPLNHARSTAQSAPSSRAAMEWPHQRLASVCGSAAALRSGFVSLNASLRSPLHFPRSPTADRSLVNSEEFYLHRDAFETFESAIFYFDVILVLSFARNCPMKMARKANPYSTGHLFGVGCPCFDFLRWS